MNLIKLQSFDSLYQSQFGHVDIHRFHVYTGNALLGKVSEVLLDEAQNYYLLVETGSWLSRKQIILPLRQGQIDSRERRINLPEGSETIAPNASEQFQSSNFAMPSVEMSAPLETSMPLESPVVAKFQPDAIVTVGEVRPPDLEASHAVDTFPSGSIASTPPQPDSTIVEGELIQLLEEQLVIDRQWRKMGEVIIRKVVETRMVEVPVRREKLIVEQISPDHRQLASIDLPLQSESVLLNPITKETQKLDNTGIPIAIAHRVLEKLQQSEELRKAHVTMQFENSNLQSQYQDWLKDYAAHAAL